MIRTIRTRLFLGITFCISVPAALATLVFVQDRSLAFYVAYSFGAVLVISALLGLFLSRRLTAPLLILSQKMREYVEGEFKLQADLGGLDHAPDEVGQVAREFGELQDAIRDHLSSISQMAYFDNLTGAASRAYMNQRLQEMISTSKRRGEGFSLFFVDLDAFKSVNDSLGHDAGDQLLIEVTNRLRDAARQSDFIARLGGDEFCVLLEGLSDEADIAVVAERCIARIETPVTIAGRTFRPQCSIGISRYPSDGNDAKELIDAGDNAMYAAKVAGHHRFEFFRKEMSQRAADRLKLAQELRAAVSNEDFLLRYQPQVDISSGEIVGWEALIHWDHPDRGMLPPDEFAPEVERLGLINELGSWIIRRASCQLAAWSDQGLGDMRVSVNVAPRQLSDRQLYDNILEALTAAKVEPGQLELAITESGIQSAPDGRRVLERLKSLGVRVAIDEFGTGHSSLASLKVLPADCLKIDRSFVQDMATNPQDAVLLGTIMAMGHALRFEIIAEGVEQLEQLQILQGLDCDRVQGSFFSQPVAAKQVPELVARGFVDGPAAESPENAGRRAG
ncbi:MAG: EAL domain-containing protein [Xanthomonadales bacterium]|nr:EAL domain-containing protein [Xanthomonadales bacterium]